MMLRRWSAARPPSLPLWIASVIASPGCEFFEELESVESAESGESATESDTDMTSAETEAEADSSCSFPADDRCLDQDRLHVCDPQSEQASTWSCTELCGSFVNFTCLGVGNGQHACWCVQPGAQKVLSCTELETCLRGCEGAIDATCADQCFARTTTGTIRTFGALVHCAQSVCHDTCASDPASCPACIQAGLTGGNGCVLERSVCDNDRNDEPEWPGAR
jgi:hypothetical protein